MKRQRPWEITSEEEAAAWWTRGGRSLTTERRKAIVDMYYDQGLEVDAIALKVPSPRGPGSVCSRTVTNVLEHYAFFGHVEKLPRKKRERAMPPHIRELLCCIAEEKPWLFQATGNRQPPFHAFPHLHTCAFSLISSACFLWQVTASMRRREGQALRRKRPRYTKPATHGRLLASFLASICIPIEP